tara:strand:- start:214 stop:342 length:129 start_codon:yes stop_codon:yes gene_type:complete
MKIKIPKGFDPWLVMENHKNPELLKKLLAIRKKKVKKWTKEK